MQRKSVPKNCAALFLAVIFLAVALGLVSMAVSAAPASVFLSKTPTCTTQDTITLTTAAPSTNMYLCANLPVPLCGLSYGIKRSPVDSSTISMMGATSPIASSLLDPIQQPSSVPFAIGSAGAPKDWGFLINGDPLPAKNNMLINTFTLALTGGIVGTTYTVSIDQTFAGLVLTYANDRRCGIEATEVPLTGIIAAPAPKLVK